MSQRQENGIDRASKNLYKEYLKGINAATSELKASPPESVEELSNKIATEKQALGNMQGMFDTFSDFGSTLSFMQGHIAGNEAVLSHMRHIESQAKAKKKDIRAKEHEKAQAKAKDNNRV